VSIRVSPPAGSRDIWTLVDSLDGGACFGTPLDFVPALQR
jgi:hypothetical protein